MQCVGLIQVSSVVGVAGWVVKCLAVAYWEHCSQKEMSVLGCIERGLRVKLNFGPMHQSIPEVSCPAMVVGKVPAWAVQGN